MNQALPSEPADSTTDRGSRSAIGRATGRFGKAFSRSISFARTGRLLRRQLWLWPVIAAVLIGAIGWWVSRQVEDSMRAQRARVLSAILDADVTAMRLWMEGQVENARLVASDERLGPMVQGLLAISRRGDARQRDFVESPFQAELRARLGPHIKPFGYIGFLVVGPTGLVLAADQDPAVDQPLSAARKEFFQKVAQGEARISKPYRSPLLLPDERGELRAGLPSMFAAAPIRDEKGRPVAALALRIRPEDQFTKILHVASSGKTGETYAFDADGVFLSRSRYDDDLKQIGLLADRPDVTSELTLAVRDPGVDLTTGARPAQRRGDQPLTYMAAEAVARRDGVNVEGYRDYRGVPVIGAWRWLPQFDFGVATEVDVAETFQPLYVLRRAFRVMTALLAVAALAIFGLMLVASRQNRRLQEAVLAAKKLGQYTLKRKIGAGGMGTVYLAEHAMLRRPTAVKLLECGKESDAAIARFEREVQLTSVLTHANTVAIYDYGRTPEGIFYYAMEYLEGMDLDDLVTRFGPLPEARAVYLLRQICGSLAEAHLAGLIHRDVKPANIFVTRRGGADDFVKVLDFGLVKSFEGQGATRLTAANMIAGTPHYIAPEAIRTPDQVDARADVYSIGAVAYFLLTGKPVFDGDSVADVCLHHIQTAPEPPSKRARPPISAALERLILRCLAKSPADRPADALCLLHELESCDIEGRWTADDASRWWAAARQRRPEVMDAAQGVDLVETSRVSNTEATVIAPKPGPAGPAQASDR